MVSIDRWDLIHEQTNDLVIVSETWHDDSDATFLKRLRAEGLQVLDQARPIPPSEDRDKTGFVNHGGVALVISGGVRTSKLNPQVDDFWASGSACIIINRSAVHRRLQTGSLQTSNLFLDKFFFVARMDLVVFAASHLTGDLNVHFEKWMTKSLVSLLSHLLASLDTLTFGHSHIWTLPHLDTPTFGRSHICNNE